MYALASFDHRWLQLMKVVELGEPSAAASGLAAAALHGFAGFRPCRPEITVPSSAAHVSRMALVHRGDAVEVTPVKGIRVVVPEQAILEVAGRAPLERVEAALDDALLSGAVDLGRLRARFEALEPLRHRGTAVARSLLATRDDGFVPPESELERHLYRLLGSPSVPPFERQARFPWRPHGRQRVDAIIPAWRLIVEGDGRRWHTRVADFDRDLARDAEAMAHGYRVLRLGWTVLTEAPDEAAARLVAAGRWTVVPAAG